MSSGRVIRHKAIAGKACTTVLNRYTCGFLLMTEPVHLVSKQTSAHGYSLLMDNWLYPVSSSAASARSTRVTSTRSFPVPRI